MLYSVFRSLVPSLVTKYDIVPQAMKSCDNLYIRTPLPNLQITWTKKYIYDYETKKLQLQFLTSCMNY